MAYQVRLSRRAERDLDAIYDYIGAELSGAAHAWFDGLEAAILSLENYPTRGVRTRERIELRQILYGRKPHVYRIIFSINEACNCVLVIYVRHGARRPLRSASSPETQ